ncbi:unnamed protein product, partial [Polarella glacialis]
NKGGRAAARLAPLSAARGRQEPEALPTRPAAFAAGDGGNSEGLVRRLCACGCGELVSSGDTACEGEVSPLQLRSGDQLFEPMLCQAEAAKAQRAYCEKLTQRRAPSQPPTPVAADAALQRMPDLERLEQMAKPRERPKTPEPPALPPKAPKTKLRRASSAVQLNEAPASSPSIDSSSGSRPGSANRKLAPLKS